jgi:hypothetical protein
LSIHIAQDPDGIVTLTYTSNPTASEGRAALDALFSTIEPTSVRGYLIDRRAVDEAPTTAYVRTMVDHAESKHPELRATHWATVVTTDAAYGMSRMIEALADTHLGVHFSVFRDIDAARAWLLLNPPKIATGF